MLTGPKLKAIKRRKTMMLTTFLFPDPNLSSLSQQDLQSPPEGSILSTQLLVVCQHRLQPSLQPLQILFLLPTEPAGRLPVLDHSLLSLQ